MANALKKQRKRARRKAHMKQVGERNRMQGHTGGPVRGHLHIERPVGVERPSYHKPKPEDREPIHAELTGVKIVAEEPVVKAINYETFDSGPGNMAEFDELKAEAKRRKKSFKKIASAAGWELIDSNAPNLPESWRRQVA